MNAFLAMVPDSVTVGSPAKKPPKLWDIEEGDRVLCDALFEVEHPGLAAHVRRYVDAAAEVKLQVLGEFEAMPREEFLRRARAAQAELTRRAKAEAERSQ